jgi:hypothetical protein
MGGGGSSDVTENVGHTTRPTQRERLAGLMGGGGGGIEASPSPRAQRRDRTAGLIGGQGTSNNSGIRNIYYVDKMM